MNSFSLSEVQLNMVLANHMFDFNVLKPVSSVIIVFINTAVNVRNMIRRPFYDELKTDWANKHFCPKKNSMVKIFFQLRVGSKMAPRVRAFRC